MQVIPSYPPQSGYHVQLDQFLKPPVILNKSLVDFQDQVSKLLEIGYAFVIDWGFPHSDHHPVERKAQHKQHSTARDLGRVRK